MFVTAAEAELGLESLMCPRNLIVITISFVYKDEIKELANNGPYWKLIHIPKYQYTEFCKSMITIHRMEYFKMYKNKHQN